MIRTGVSVVAAAATVAVLLHVHAKERDADAWWILFHPAAAASTQPPALSPEALEQRSRLRIAVRDNDRPLPDSLLRMVERSGARIRHVSRWLRAVSVEAHPAALERLRAHGAVRAVRPVASVSAASASRHMSSAAVQTADSMFYGANWQAIRELGIPGAHLVGFTGSGVRVAILDTGFELAHDALAARRIFRTRDFIDGDSDVGDPAGSGLLQARHGTRVFSILGGHDPGELVGPAHGAEFILAKVDVASTDTRADEDRWIAAVEWADSLGARVINSSVVFRWDYSDRPPIPFDSLNGDLTRITVMADEAARRGIVLVTAMGNGGPLEGSLSAPADADTVIAVAAVTALGQAAQFAQGASGRGPTADGRIKPEVSARGTGLTAASTLGNSTYETGLAGTSYSTALIGGAVAVFVQAWPELSPAAVRRAFLLAGNRPNRDNAVGAGVPDVASAILFPEGLDTAGVATIDLDRNLTTIAPQFSWSAPLVQPAMRPILYRIEVARDPVFNQIIHSDTVREAFSFTVRTPIRPAPALWWRVTATTSLGVRRVTPVAGPVTMPNWVTLIAPNPARVTFVDSVQPTLRWTPLEAPPGVGPFTYDVQVLSAETGQPVQPTMRDISTSAVRVAQPLSANVAYRWRVIARTPGGVADTVQSASSFVVTSVTRPPVTLLYQNFPNPFPGPAGGGTRIWFDLASQSDVELAVFDLRARLIRRLVPSSPACGVVTLESGQYGRTESADPCVRTTWDGDDQEGRRVPRGVYVLRLRAGGREEYRRIVFLGGN